jgi:SAM-dependent methyltransferase
VHVPVTIPIFDTPLEKEYWDIHQFRFEFLKQEILKLPLSNGAEVLDVGCFPPIIFNFLKEQGFAVSGIASQHEKMMDTNIAVLNIETERFPWENNTFELAVLTEVIEHLPHSPVTPLEEVKRVLKPGGYVVITTPNAAKLHHRLKLLAGQSTSFPIHQLREVKHGDGSLYHLHNREYTLGELAQLLEWAGLEVVRAEQLCLYPPTRKKVAQEPFKNRVIKWAGFAAQQLHSSFKDSLYIIAQKPKK